MNHRHPALRILLILALLLNGIVAAQAAVRHELALAKPVAASGMECHEHDAGGQGEEGQTHHPGKFACCMDGGCFCACAVPSLLSSQQVVIPPLPPASYLLLPASSYRSYTAPTLLRPPIV